MNIAEYPRQPVYLNPDFDECVKLGRDAWDTLRICEDETIFVIASGYGNDHQSIIVQLRAHLKIKRWHPSTFIVYRKHSHIYFNFEDVSGNKCVPWRDALRFFEPVHQVMIRDVLTTAEEKFSSEEISE